MKMLRGIIPPLITPLDEQGQVDELSVQRLVEYVRPFSGALMPTLSSGEGWALSTSQWRDMVTYTKRYAGALPVLAGIELSTTEAVIEWAWQAVELQIGAIVITTPFAADISQAEIVDHFRQVKSASQGVPIFIYNEELISGNEIALETMRVIVDLGGVVGIKEASGSAAFTKRLIKIDLGVPIFQGWENLCLDSIGVDGYILPLSNLEPELCKSMIEEPTLEKQVQINNLCEKYELLDKQWFVSLKRELKRRGIIATERVV